MFRAFCAIFVYFGMENLKNCLYGKYSYKNTKFNPNQNVEISIENIITIRHSSLPLISGSEGWQKVAAPKKWAVQKIQIQTWENKLFK